MTTIVEVRGEPGLFKTTDLPSEEVRLPMALRAARRLPWAGLYIGIVGLLLAPPGILLLLKPQALLEYSFIGMVALAGVCVVGTAAGFCILGTALTAFADTCRRGPLLVLDDASLWDKRSTRVPLSWTDIEHATVRFTRGGVGGVHLKLRRKIKARHNPLRLGTLSFLWQRRPDELHISVMCLEQKPRTIALVITEMVLRNGGTADTKHPYAGTSL